ncbi:MAG: hypothetical protein F6K26_53205 [Moorea sp. SIO2I5]|nr:hypothetical protein [Moorena sp. SIO2I5]
MRLTLAKRPRYANGHPTRSLRLYTFCCLTQWCVTGRTIYTLALEQKIMASPPLTHPTHYCLLPIAYCLFPTPYSLLPTPSSPRISHNSKPSPIVRMR